MSEYAKQRARNKIVWLARQGLDLVTFWRDSNRALASAVPHFMSPCWYTLDPTTLTALRERYDKAVTSGIVHNRHRDWDSGGNHPGYTLAT